MESTQTINAMSNTSQQSTTDSLSSFTGNQYNLNEIKGKYVFQEGETFDTCEELLNRLDMHSKESLVYYWRRDSRSVERAFTKTSRQIASKLKYYVVRFACIYGGIKNYNNNKSLEITSNKQSNHQHHNLIGSTGTNNLLHTTRTNCPAYIQLRASKCGQKLEVISVCNLHNHEISERISQTLPQNRKLTSIVKEEVNELLRLKIDRKKIMEYVKKRENKIITAKDLFNMATRLTKQKELHLSSLASSYSVEEIKRRIVTLRRISDFMEDKALMSIIRNEISSYESELSSILYSIEDGQNDHLIEYISPEYEFGINQTIIDSIIEEAKQNEMIECSSGSINDFPSKKIPEMNETQVGNHEKEHRKIEDKSENLETTNSKNFVIISENESANLLNLSDFIIEEDDGDYQNFIIEEENFNMSDTIIDENNKFNDNSNIMESFSASETLSLFSSSSSSPSSALNESSSVLHQNTIQINDSEDKTNDIKENNADDDAVNQIEKESKIKNSRIKKSVQNNRKRILNCTKCGTNTKLLHMQVNYLKNKIKKLSNQTDCLKLKKLKLRLEIEKLKKDLI